MSERIADLRGEINDLEEAIRVFDALAAVIIKLAASDAGFEKRVAEMKSAHESKTSEFRTLSADGEALLARFIDSHKDLFQDPRKIKTSLGSFGLQAVSELVIDNPVRLERHLTENKIEDCFELAFQTIKTAIRKRLEAGEKLPGCRIVSGDTAVYKVDKTLVDQARKNAT